jgi:hypothetical protein
MYIRYRSLLLWLTIDLQSNLHVQAEEKDSSDLGARSLPKDPFSEASLEDYAKDPSGDWDSLFRPGWSLGDVSYDRLHVALFSSHGPLVLYSL